MVNCKDCGLKASYGIKGQKATHCAKHALDGMVDIKNKRCAEPESFSLLNLVSHICLIFQSA